MHAPGDSTLETRPRLPRVSHGWLLTALAGAAALVLAAPFVGVARSALRTAFPGRFTLIVNAAVAGAALVAIATAIWRVQDDRLKRYGALALAGLAAAAYVRWTGSVDPAIRAVETFHFVEYGAITALFYRAWRDLRDGSALALPALAAFTVGIAEEAYQWFLPARVGELKDVWLNGVAILCGLVASAAIAPSPGATQWPSIAAARVCRMLALVVVTLAAFVHMVHLGHEVRDGATTFVSRYTAVQLARQHEARQALWRTHPPTARPNRLSREDQYMTEGLQHIQARNTALAAGDATTAWHENAILERHFPSVLQTPSYVAASGHQWTDDQRRQVEAAAGPGVERVAFASAAFPYPIYLWSPLVLWAGALSLALCLWGSAVFTASRAAASS